jgi:hypothetical protein
VDELVAGVEPEQHRHDGEREQARVRGRDIGPEDVGEPEQRQRHVGVAPGEIAHRGLGLDDVALDLGSRRVRARHVLGEEGRIVLLGAVVVGRRLEDELAHGRVRPAAGGEDVHRPDHVALVDLARRRDRRVDDQARVDDGVDLGGGDDPPQQRVVGADAHELGSVELPRRVVRVDADDRLDLGPALDRLGKPAAPVGGQARDQHPARARACELGPGHLAHPNQTDSRSATISSRFCWIRARISWA